MGGEPWLFPKEIVAFFLLIRYAVVYSSNPTPDRVGVVMERRWLV